MEAISGQNGRYKITATTNDTLQFRFVGLTTEKIPVKKQAQDLNLIMIDRTVNDLGAIWTKRQYRKTDRQIEKRLKKLYKKADKQKVWKNSSCQQ